jgi:hypothetical protein
MLFFIFTMSNDGPYFPDILQEPLTPSRLYQVSSRLYQVSSKSLSADLQPSYQSPRVINREWRCHTVVSPTGHVTKPRQIKKGEVPKYSATQVANVTFSV